MPDRDIDLLEHCVREAGDIARKFYGGDYKSWSKSGGSPVTEADLAVDASLKKNLLVARPAYGWLSEESADDPRRLETERVFVVDPIDGTVAFLKGRPHFTICAAVVEKGRPIAGIVYNPILEECFAATREGGAVLNGAPIHPTARRDIAGCRMLGSKGAFDGWPAMEIAHYSSLAYRVALVAAGRHDAMVSLTTKHDWDLAAADVILTEAGGLLTDGAGDALIYNRRATTQRATIASGPTLHPALLKQIVP